MGLNISTLDYHGYTNTNERFGSYRYLHVLRQWVGKEIDKLEFSNLHELYSDKNIRKTKFPVLIDHNDSEGGYLSFSEFGIEKVKDSVEWNDLDKLRLEMKELKKHHKEMPPEVKECFDDFYKFVFDKVDGEIPVSMVIFH